MIVGVWLLMHDHASINAPQPQTLRVVIRDLRRWVWDTPATCAVRRHLADALLRRSVSEARVKREALHVAVKQVCVPLDDDHPRTAVRKLLVSSRYPPRDATRATAPARGALRTAASMGTTACLIALRTDP